MAKRAKSGKSRVVKEEQKIVISEKDLATLNPSIMNTTIPEYTSDDYKEKVKLRPRRKLVPETEISEGYHKFVKSKEYKNIVNGKA